MDREKLENCTQWLGTKELPCDIINIVRNIVQRNGTSLKNSLCIKGGVKRAYYVILRPISIEQKNYKQSDRMIVRFEDLKCHPKETLESICGRWDIMWSDTLMQTTRAGRECFYTDNVYTVSGFDLRPVYNTYHHFTTF